MSESTDKERRKAPRRKSRLPEGSEATRKREHKRALAGEAAAWARACADITASITSEHVRRSGRFEVDPKVVYQAMVERIEDAKRELGDHVVGDTDCPCRHHAILTVGAMRDSVMSGVRQDLIFDSARARLEMYLARRN